MRCQPSAIVRTCAVAGFALVMSSILPTPVGVAQSAPPPAPWRGLIDHVSATQTGGVPTVSVEAVNRAISGDGRFVVMQSFSQELTPGDLTWSQDIFLRDRQTGTMTRVSVAEDGTDPNGFSDSATISTNGQHVAFASSASNLVPGDTNGVADIFVRDLAGARTVRVSVATDGIQSDGESYMPALSATGRFVAFVSSATTLVPGQATNAFMQVYLHDRDTDADGIFDEPAATATTLESVSATGAVADNYTQHVRVSADGRFVLFESSATNLDAAGNPNGSTHIYLRDRQAGTTTLIDRSVTGGPSMWGVDNRGADMSDDGRFITYSTYSPDIVLADGTWNSQALRYDSQAAGPRTTLVSALPDGTLGNGFTIDTSVSADGRYVAFRATSTNLAAPAHPESGAAIFVRDMTTGTFTRIDVLTSGEGFDHSWPRAASLSADGTAVAFSSNARNAVDGVYTSGSEHTFVATAFAVSPTSASFPNAGGSGAIDVIATPVSGWHAVSLDSWIVLTEGGGFAAGSRTVQFTVVENPSPVLRHGRIKLGSTIVAIQQEGSGDTTPPVITPIVSGTLHPSGWYTSDITVQWSISDPDSEVLSIGPGCVTSTFTSDFLYASPTCEATSHGGTASVSVPLRRDTTPPAINISSPLAAYYRTGTTITPAFTCQDPSGHSGVASCQRTDGTGPLDTTTPGWRPFTVSAVDQAGNTSSKTVDYLIGTGVCVPQSPTLKAWWRFNSTMLDTVGRLQASPSHSGGFYDTGVAGKAWTHTSTSNRLVVSDGLRLLMPSALTVALWVKPTGFSGQSGTLVTKPAHYRIARYPDGTLRWAFSHTTGYDWVSTGAVIPMNVWSHVAVTYDQGLVRSYLNGRLVHSQQLSGTLVFGAHEYESLTIAGRNDVAATLLGTFDDVQIYDRPMEAADVDALARAGSGTLCVPNGSTLTVTVPQTIAYGSTFTATADLRDETGNPVPNRHVTFRSQVSPSGFAGTVNAVTNAAGQAVADLPIAASASLAAYTPAAVAIFDGDVVYRESTGQASATLVSGTPAITWSSPAPIVYGTPLSGLQLNATGSVPGSFSYSPAAGSVLNAGTHSLGVTFTPTDSAHWAQATATVDITVDKAVPQLQWSPAPGSIVYGTPLAEAHFGATANVPGTFSYTPGPGTVLNAGTHTLSATFTPADAVNYTTASIASTVVVTKATPTVTWTAPAAMVYGTELGATELNATSTVPGTFTYTPAAGTILAAGSHVLSVRFAPEDAANYEAVSADTALTVTRAAAALTWNAPAPIVYGAALGAAQLNATANVPGTFTYSHATGTLLPAGTHTLSVTFTPSDATNYTGASLERTLAVGKAPLSIAANNASKPYGAALPSFSAAATGFVNGDSLASLGGVLTYATPASSTSAVGTYPVVPLGLSSANYDITFIAGTLAIVRAETVLVVGASPNPLGINQPVTYTAGIGVLAPGAGAPGGSVQFFDNGTLIGTAPVLAGMASLTTNGLPAGAHTISATYAGDSSFGASTGATSLTVQPAAMSSTTALTSTRNPASPGQAVTFRATVSGPSGSVSGTVEFYDGANLLGSAVIAGGVAQLTTAWTDAGGHAIVARYLGNGSLPPSVSLPLAQTIGTQTKASTTSLSISPAGATLGNEVTLTATVTGGQQRAPGGAVLFLVNGHIVGEAPTSVTGSITATAVFRTSLLPRGTHTIAVVYLGDSTFRAGSRSTTLTIN